MAKTSTQRSKEKDDRHRKAGEVQRRIWATPEEHEQVKKSLIELRKS